MAWEASERASDGKVFVEVAFYLCVDMFWQIIELFGHAARVDAARQQKVDGRNSANGIFNNKLFSLEKFAPQLRLLTEPGGSALPRQNRMFGRQQLVFNAPLLAISAIKIWMIFCHFHFLLRLLGEWREWVYLLRSALQASACSFHFTGVHTYRTEKQLSP